MRDLEKQSDKIKDEYQPPLSTYYKSKTTKTKKDHLIKAIMYFGILILVVLLAGGGYNLYHHHKSHKPKVSSTSMKPTGTSNYTSSTSNYVSNGNDLNLSFNYPSSWKVTPPSNHNPNDNPITVTSPLYNLQNYLGKAVVGKVVVQVLAGGTTISQLNSPNPVAAQASTQFAYTSPTADQYQYPYLTLINLDTSLTSNIPFQFMVVTSTPYSISNQVTNSDLTGLDPIIMATIYQCSTEACNGSGAKPLAISSNQWQNGQLFTQTLKLIESFELN